MNLGNISHPIWLVMPMMVMMKRTNPSAAIWMGIRNTSNGITIAPVSASHGWNDMAAHAVGGRLS